MTKHRYRCGPCGSTDPLQYQSCHRPDCPDGRDQGLRPELARDVTNRYKFDTAVHKVGTLVVSCPVCSHDPMQAIACPNCMGRRYVEIEPAEDGGTLLITVILSSVLVGAGFVAGLIWASWGWKVLDIPAYVW